MIRQHLCQALYSADRTNDACEAFLELVKASDEEVHMSASTVDWISSE